MLTASMMVRRRKAEVLTELPPKRRQLARHPTIRPLVFCPRTAHGCCCRMESQGRE